MDFGKYKYEMEKKEKHAKKSAVIHIKEIRLKPNIAEHDYHFKMEHIKSFLGAENKVKIIVVFKGRELLHLENGRKILERLKQDTNDICNILQDIKFEGKIMSMVLISKK